MDGIQKLTGTKQGGRLRDNDALGKVTVLGQNWSVGGGDFLLSCLGGHAGCF